MKKILALFLLAAGVLGAADIPEPQGLLSEQQQKEQGFDRQRQMYPRADARRMSQAASQKGFALLFQKRDLAGAMNEFNRAWRFDPENPNAYWGGGIVCGQNARALKDAAQALRWMRNSVALLEKSASLTRSETQIQVKCDLALSCSDLGRMLLVGKDLKGSTEMLERGKCLAEEAIKAFPDQGRTHDTASLNALYRGDLETARRESALAESCKNPVRQDADFKKELKSISAELAELYARRAILQTYGQDDSCGYDIKRDGDKWIIDGRLPSTQNAGVTPHVELDAVSGKML